MKLPKIGLALGSGVARGWAHIGVLRALANIGIKPDIVVGSSVGALVGGMYLANHIDALEEWARAMTKMKMVSYLDLRVKSGGLIAGGRLLHDLEQQLAGIKIEDLPIPFSAIATDLVTGHEVWLQKGSLIEALRASFSLPGVFPPIKLDGRWLLDGALVNPVPVATCRALGAEMVIAVNLSSDLLGKIRKPGTSIPSIAGFDLLQLIEEEQQRKPDMATSGALDALSRRLFRRDYDGPSLFGVMVSTISIMQDRVARSRLAGDPPDVHITPRLGHVGLLEFDRADETIKEGEAAVMRAQADLGDAFRVFFSKGGHGHRNPERSQGN